MGYDPIMRYLQTVRVAGCIVLAAATGMKGAEVLEFRDIFNGKD
jgi:hypothetical protein